MKYSDLVKLISAILLFGLVGCASQKHIILLPEDRIYTAPAGKPMSLLLDGKAVDITFSKDMKVVDPTTLVRQEENLNKETRKRVKTEKSRNKMVGALGGIIALITSVFTYLNKKKNG